MAVLNTFEVLVALNLLLRLELVPSLVALAESSGDVDLTPGMTMSRSLVVKTLSYMLESWRMIEISLSTFLAWY